MSAASRPDAGAAPSAEQARILRLERRLSRECRAREEAERLLDCKARELYDANQDLGFLTAELKQRVGELERERERIVHLARTDAMTGLLNRAALIDSVAARLDEHGADDGEFALLALDLDSFKAINDSRGHAAGDAVLRTISGRLREIAGSYAVIARVGGDEFQIFLRVADAIDGLQGLGRRILDALIAPIMFDDAALHAGGSIGVARFPRDASTSEELRQNADLALYEAKRRGGSCVRVFDASMRLVTVARNELSRELKIGLERGEIEPWFQPIVPSLNAQAAAPNLEMLSRWRHPTRGMVSPGIFVPLAEEGGFVSGLTEAMLRGAGLSIAEWAASGAIGYATCNVSMLEFHERRFAARFVEMAADYGLPLGQLVVEITETSICEDPGLAQSHICDLSKAGVRIALDDFGAGYSNLRALIDLQIHTLKLDRSLIAEIDGDARIAEVLRGVVQVGRAMGARIVAEGVETQRQAEMVSAAGCHGMQGFLFAKPMPKAAIMHWISQNGGAGGSLLPN